MLLTLVIWNADVHTQWTVFFTVLKPYLRRFVLENITSKYRAPSCHFKRDNLILDYKTMFSISSNIFERIFIPLYTAQTMKCPIKDFFSKCDQIRSFLRTWSHLLKKSIMENFIFCAMVFPVLALTKTLIRLSSNCKLMIIF